MNRIASVGRVIANDVNASIDAEKRGAITRPLDPDNVPEWLRGAGPGDLSKVLDDLTYQIGHALAHLVMIQQRMKEVQLLIAPQRENDGSNIHNRG
jgi:hypothetical protein